MKSIKYTFFLFMFLLLPASSYAQEIVLGADFVSRYVWRGFDLGADAPSLQPNVAIVAGGFTAGFWGAYSFSNEEALDEIDFYASYSFALGENSGALSLGFTDYMNPNNGIPLSNFNNYDAVPLAGEDASKEGPGAHYIEINANYSGPESFPISLSLNMFAYNVEKNPLYFQVGYNTAVKDVGLSLFIGGTNGQSGLEYSETYFYGTDKFDITNVGFTASKTIPITESFSLPIYGSVIVNPAADHMFYVLGIKI
jgi:hypothetical protein